MNAVSHPNPCVGLRALAPARVAAALAAPADISAVAAAELISSLRARSSSPLRETFICEILPQGGLREPAEAAWDVLVNAHSGLVEMCDATVISGMISEHHVLPGDLLARLTPEQLVSLSERGVGALAKLALDASEDVRLLARDLATARLAAADQAGWFDQLAAFVPEGYDVGALAADTVSVRGAFAPHASIPSGVRSELSGSEREVVATAMLRIAGFLRAEALAAIEAGDRRELLASKPHLDALGVLSSPLRIILVRDPGPTQEVFRELLPAAMSLTPQLAQS